MTKIHFGMRESDLHYNYDTVRFVTSVALDTQKLSYVSVVNLGMKEYVYCSKCGKMSPKLICILAIFYCIQLQWNPGRKMLW